MQLTQRQRTHALQHCGGAGAAWHMVTSEAAMQQHSARKSFLPMVDRHSKMIQNGNGNFHGGNYDDQKGIFFIQYPMFKDVAAF